MRRAAAATLLGFAALGCDAGYEVIDLSRYESADGTRLRSPKRINNRGDIIGRAANSRELRFREGTAEVLDTLPGGTDPRSVTGAEDLNDAGVAVGFSGNTAVVWEPGKPVRKILEAAGTSEAVAITNSGLVVGSIVEQGKERRVFVAAPGAEAVELSPEPGYTANFPFAVNNKAQVVGISAGRDKEEMAFLWDSGRMTKLPRIYPKAINDDGLIVGCDHDRPVLLDRDGSVVVLAEPQKRPDGEKRGCANAINARGEVVGFVSRPHGDVAFIWDAKAGFRNLNDLADASAQNWQQFSEAVSINDRGEIIGWASANESGASEPFLLRPSNARFPNPRPVIRTAMLALLLIAIAWLSVAMLRGKT